MTIHFHTPIPAGSGRRSRWLTLGACLLALGGCASGPTVRMNYDTTADFTKFRTFAFVSPLGTDRGGNQTLVSKHLVAATQRELVARGMRLDATAPQLLINFNAKLSDRLLVTSAPVATVGVSRGYYGYRTGIYSAWPAYSNELTAMQYTEGTLNIDVIDAARKQLVWESVVTDSVTQADLENVQVAINAAIAAAFARYPVPAQAK